MNEIVIDISNFSPEVQNALKDRAVREGKPMKQLLADLIATTTQAVLTAAGESPSKEVA
jgi:phenylpyruvate tautomerase PptA (4-oxalocrotonate tautomerase family)